MLKLTNYAATSLLKNVHPLEKAVFSFTFLLFSIVTKSIAIASISLIVMSAALLLKAKISFITYVRLLMLPLFFLTTSLIAFLFSISSIEAEVLHSIWQAEIGNWQIYVQQTSVNQGLQIAMTAMASISCMYFFILTTPIQQMIWLLQKLKLPPLIVELVVFIYHFIFVLLEKAVEIYIAQASRLGYQSYRNWLPTIAQLIVALFVKATVTARELQFALDSRGGGEGFGEIQLQQKYCFFHWLTLLLLCLILAIVAVTI